ncbi:FAD-dependent oxidoreductase [Rubrimonas cliftonensis]|nr:FAD-dependent oxidoreductase [Rubrimonas cliftonensis]
MASDGKTRIVVLGGGFAGVHAARALRRRLGADAEVTLINATNHFVFQPFLPEVAGGLINASDAVSPLRALLPGVRVRVAEVHGVDFEAKTVTVVQGMKRRPIPEPYDHLAIALGLGADLSGVPGMADHAYPIKSLADAHRLRNRVITCLEHADVTQDRELKRRLLNFVVIGAGFSGIEVAGELRELIDGALRYYPRIDRAEVGVHVLEFAPRILNELPESLASYAQARLEARGVSIRCGVAAKSLHARRLRLSNGETIESETVVATIGAAPHALVAALPLPNDRGRIRVDRSLRVEGRDDVWALGDAALIPLKDAPRDRADWAPPTAQFAVREARLLGDNVAAALAGAPLKPFAYASKGSMASLGGRRAVATVFGLRLSGFAAWLLWKAFYLSFLPGVATRVRVLVNWLLAAVLPRNAVQIDQSAARAARTVHFNAGDQVFEPGMISRAFYVILTGAFELTIEENRARRTLRLGPGEHFGERVILGEGERTGSVRVLEDSTVLRIEREDFERFAQGFAPLRDYFDRHLATRLPEDAPGAEAVALRSAG